MLSFVLLVLLAGIGFQSPPPSEASEPSAASPRRERMRPQRAARLGEFLAADPQRQREIRLERMWVLVGRTYDLTDEQRPAVHDVLRKMQSEHYAAMGPDGAELDRLQKQMAEYWSSRLERDEPGRGRGAWQDPEFRALRDQLAEIRARHPFDMDAAAARIEALLPPEQAEAGRQRRAEWRERRMRWEQGREAREVCRGRGEGPADSTNPEARPRAAERRRERFEAQRERWMLRRTEREATPPPDGVPLAPQAADEHPWRRYAREFAAANRLDAAQRASVEAVLKDVLARAEDYRRAKARELGETMWLPPSPERDAKMRELQAPLDNLFEEVRSRLDDLLTAEQRAARG